MKIILGIVIGAALMIGGVAFAATVDLHGVVLISELSDSFSGEAIRKYYDYDNSVVCYTNDGNNSGGISCLRN